MTQPAKGQELSMDEILASIRRIITDDPPGNSRAEAARSESLHTEPARNDGQGSEGWREESETLRTETPRTETLRTETLRTEGLRTESLRTERLRTENLWSESANNESPPHESPSQAMAAEEAAPQARAPLLPAPPSRPDPLASRVMAQPRPPGPAARAASPTPPDPAAQHEEIDAMLARLHAGALRPLPEPEPEPASEIFELTEQMVVPQPLPAVGLAISDDLVELECKEESVVDAPEQPQPATLAHSGREQQHPPIRNHVRDAEREFGREGERGRGVSGKGLVSEATISAVDSAFNTLAQTVLVQNGRTLEDLVREMLRPMLKVWLDDNLPSMVERLVRAEIERVSRGRG
jgi:cell pole-organizing protein PopZ